MSEIKYDAFISYSHSEPDAYVAEKLHTMLEHYHISKKLQKISGKKKIKRVFRDREELPLSSDLAANIREALENSEFLIVVCSPRAVRSEWVQREIETFLETHEKDKVLTLLTEGEPEEVFPEVLCYNDEVVLRENGEKEVVRKKVEPMAADIRGRTRKETEKKLKEEFLRILAPMLSCTYDTLRQRHREYRFRRIIAVTGAAAVLAVMFTVYAFYQASVSEGRYQEARRNQARYLSEISGELLAEGDREGALQTALAIAPEGDAEGPVVPEQMYALNNALYSYDNNNKIKFRPAYSAELDGETGGMYFAGRLNSEETGYFCVDMLGNAYVINPENGALVSVWDKRFQKEMVNPKSEYGFGEYVHEKFGNDEIDRYNNSYVKLGNHGWADPEMARPKDEVLQYAMEKGKVRRIKYDKTSHSVRATVFCQTKAGDDYLLSYALEDYSPYVEINWSLRNKPADPQPEAGWLVFPFNVDEPTFRLGRTGGVVNPVVDFIKNTNHDYFFVNTGLAVINGQGDGFGLNTPNAPAISLDRPGLFRFSGSFVPQRSNVFVNLFNNQWGTNFTEWIEGGLSAKMYLWSVSSYGNEKSLITPIEETRTPLLATYVEGKGGLLPRMASGITLSKKGILLTAYGPNRNGDGDVLRLWEQAGETGKCIITIPSSAYHKAQPCNLRGEPIGEPLEIRQQQLEVDIRAYQPLSLILLK